MVNVEIFYSLEFWEEVVVECLVLSWLLILIFRGLENMVNERVWELGDFYCCKIWFGCFTDVILNNLLDFLYIIIYIDILLWVREGFIGFSFSLSNFRYLKGVERGIVVLIYSINIDIGI